MVPCLRLSCLAARKILRASPLLLPFPRDPATTPMCLTVPASPRREPFRKNSASSSTPFLGCAGLSQTVFPTWNGGESSNEAPTKCSRYIRRGFVRSAARFAHSRPQPGLGWKQFVVSTLRPSCCLLFVLLAILIYHVAETPVGVHLCCRRPSPHGADSFRSDQYRHEYARLFKTKFARHSFRSNHYRHEHALPVLRLVSPDSTSRSTHATINRAKRGWPTNHCAPTNDPRRKQAGSSSRRHVRTNAILQS